MKAGAVLGLCASAVLAVSAHALTLVKDGKAASVIVLANNPVPSQKAAAKELQYHLKKMTGAELPVIAEKDLGNRKDTLILVGQSDLLKSKGIDTTKLPNETMIVKTIDGALVLAGEDGGNVKEDFTSSRVRTGTLYAVYDLLEDQLGVRWLWPGETGEAIPRRATVEIGQLDIQETPKLIQRHYRMGMIPPSEQIGCEALPRYTADYAKLHEQMAVEEALWLKRMRMGNSERISYGHAFQDWYDKYKDTMPEVLALQPNGTRGLPNDTQPKNFVKICVAEPKTLEIMVEKYKQDFAKNPNYHYFNAVENDGSAGFCVCEKCKAMDMPTEAERKALLDLGMDGSEIDKQYGAGRDGNQPLSHRYFTFYNQLARKLREIDPEAKVVTYAYSRYRTAPIGLKLEPNIVVGLIGFNNYPMDERQHKAEIANFMAWKQCGAQMLFFRPNSFYHIPGVSIPYSSVHQMGDDLNLLINNGMIATDFDRLNGYWSTCAPTYYVLARMQWDTSMTSTQLLDEWCQGFGPAAAPIKDYFDMWEKAYLDGMTGPDSAAILAKADAESGMRRPKGVGLVLTADEFAKAHELLNQARALAEPAGDEGLLQRIHVLELGLQHGELMTESARFSIANNVYENDYDLTEHWPLVQKIYAIRNQLEALHAHNFFYSNSFEIRLHDAFDTRVWHDFYGRPYAPVMTPADKKWAFQVDPAGVGETEGWQNTEIQQPKEFNRNPYVHIFYAGWDYLKGMTAWHRKSGKPEAINGWYQVTFAVPENAGPDAVIFIPYVDGTFAKVWVDGKLIKEVSKDQMGAAGPIVIKQDEAGIKPGQDFRLTILVHSPKGGGMYGPAYIAKPE